jgi:hypothetical protein
MSWLLRLQATTATTSCLQNAWTLTRYFHRKAFNDSTVPLAYISWCYWTTFTLVGWMEDAAVSRFDTYFVHVLYYVLSRVYSVIDLNRRCRYTQPLCINSTQCIWLLISAWLCYYGSTKSSYRIIALQRENETASYRPLQQIYSVWLWQHCYYNTFDERALYELNLCCWWVLCVFYSPSGWHPQCRCTWR